MSRSGSCRPSSGTSEPRAEGERELEGLSGGGRELEVKGLRVNFLGLGKLACGDLGRAFTLKGSRDAYPLFPSPSV